MEDTLKQLESTANAMKHEINSYQSASYKTIKRRKIFRIHIIQDTMTLTETSVKDPQRYRFVEIRSAIIPTVWEKRKQWTKVFELIATLYASNIHQSILSTC